MKLKDREARARRSRNPVVRAPWKRSRMDLDPRNMQDWEIAAAAEERMKPIQQLATELGLQGEELIPYGNRLAKVS